MDFFFTNFHCKKQEKSSKIDSESDYDNRQKNRPRVSDTAGQNNWVVVNIDNSELTKENAKLKDTNFKKSHRAHCQCTTPSFLWLGGNWKKYGKGTKIYMYGEPWAGIKHNYESFTGVSAHEFGHVFGIGDAYKDLELGYKGAPQNLEIPIDDIMRSSSTGHVTANDIEAMLQAFSTGDWQALQEDDEEVSEVVKFNK